jgi:TolB protein
LTAVAGADTTPAWSPDGQRIAFASERMGPRLLFIMQSDGTRQIQLTPKASPTPPEDLAPTWSPDGRRLAFVTKRGQSAYSEIYVINADGTGLQRLTNSLEEDTDPVWSPDGQTIAYASGIMPRYQLMTMRPDGSQQRLLNANFDTGDHPSWSPDGKSVVFSRQGDNIVVTGITHTQPQVLTRQAYRELDPVWAPR